MTLAKSIASAAHRPSKKAAGSRGIRVDEILVGKDVLELISSAMYLDPMTVYREYVQNAADSIDLAKRQGLLDPSLPGRVDIDFDSPSRTVRIRDNGTGISSADFVQRLSAIGASTKRGTDSRGFRGVGRLAGLGYAQELIFRSRVEGESTVSELRWDCRKLKSALRSPDFQEGVGALVSHIATLAELKAGDFPERFFEVEMRGIVRLRTDKLMTPAAVVQYLSQVAPVPFDPAFDFGADITAALKGAFDPGELYIHVAGSDAPVYRPHQNTFDAGGGRNLPFEEVEILEIPDVDGQCAALVWVLHHPYEGAIPAHNLIKGLRLRAGNIQVGDNIVLEELFTEPRFNAWCIGEIHVLDKRILPNGRRDHFEQNAHLNNLLNQLGPTVRMISKQCRSNSIRRNWMRKFELQETVIREGMDVLKQGSIAASERADLSASLVTGLGELNRIAAMTIFQGETAIALGTVVDRLTAEVAAEEAKSMAPDSPLTRLPKAKQEMYEHLFGLIYECSLNRIAAKKLVDRILGRVLADG